MGYEAFEAQVDEHADDIKRLWATSLSDPRIADVVDRRMRWLYHESPDGPARTWLVSVEGTGDVVGCASILPRWLTVDGRRVRAGLLCDFAVDPAHRVLGPAVKLQRALAEGSLDAGFEFLYGRPNQAALPVFKRLGFTVVCEDVPWVKLLNLEFKLRERMPSVLARAGGAVTGLGLGLNDRRRLLGRSRYDVAVLERAPQVTSALLQAERRRARVVPEQPGSYLGWRYDRHATQEFRYFCVSDPGSERVKGFVVYHPRADNKLITETIVCGDDPDLGFDLVLHFSRTMRRRGHDLVFVSLACREDEGERLARSGFVRREGSDKLVCFVDPRQPEELQRVLSRGENWCLHSGEMDI